MFFELFLGLRYLKAKRKQTFISVITIISVAGVMLGVMALIVVLSVMNGFRADLMSKILGVNAHLVVMSYKGGFSQDHDLKTKIESINGVIGLTPFVYSQVMIKSASHVAAPVLRGLDVETAGHVIQIGSMIREGSLEDLGRTHDGLPGIIIGTELAKILGVGPGGNVTLVSPEGRLTPLGRIPGSRKYRVTGRFDSGMYEYDTNLVFLSLKEAQEFLNLGDQVTGLEVKVSDIDKSGMISGAIAQELGYPYWTKDWKQMNRSLVSALELEKFAMAVILLMIVLVGALNIISTLVMVVMEKSRDVAILRAMGARAKSIMAIFIFQGVLVGFSGTIAGLLSGLGICHLLGKYQFIKLPADVYYLSTLPVQVEKMDVFLVTFSALMISFLATLYPSCRASRFNPVEALRYE